MQSQKHHHELTNGVGKCSVPMWSNGMPDGFCDADAYGGQTREDKINDKMLGRYKYIPGLACPGHGGPKPAEVLNLCDYCSKHISTCNSNPSFGCGHGNDNVFQCSEFKGKEASNGR